MRGFEAYMGLPAAMCLRVAASHANRWSWTDSALLLGLAGAIAAFNLLFWVEFVLQLMAPPWLNLLLFMAPLAVMGAVWIASQVLLTGRALEAYRDEPWCLNCRYPVPPVPFAAPEGNQAADTICPECGEAIPPEIAKLAAERAGRAERGEGATAET